MERLTPEERRRIELAREIDRKIVSRREFLWRAGLVTAALGAAPALLSACGGGEEAAPAGEAPATTGGATSAEQPTIGGTLDFFSWEGYDFPDKEVPSMAAWKKENGVTVKSNYIGNHDDIQAKLTGGGGQGIDLITYYQGYKALYEQLGILTPLDPAKLPNLENLFPFFASDERNYWLDPDGTRTGVPMFWGALGVNYDSALTRPPDTYDVLFEPSFKGKVAVIDDPVGVFTHAGRILGHDVSQLSEDAFTEISDWLTRLTGQTKGISASYGDATSRLVSGDAVFAWPGWYAVNSFAADAGKDTIKTTLPREGGYSFCDSYAIPPTSDNVDTAHAFINQGIDAHVNAEAANYLVGGTTCQASVPFLAPDVAELYDYAKFDEFVEKAPFFPNPPVESDQYVTYDRIIAAWQEIKASA
jgi:spermidine/putrescine transport system substrate-binding protein